MSRKYFSQNDAHKLFNNKRLLEHVPHYFVVARRTGVNMWGMEKIRKKNGFEWRKPTSF